MKNHKIKVLCVDDVPDVTRLFSRLIESEPDLACVGALHSADHLAEAVARLTPDVVLLDLTMPGKDPLDALAEVADRFPAARVIVYSGHDDRRTADAASAAGAWGLISKDSDFSRVADAVRQVAAGRRL